MSMAEVVERDALHNAAERELSSLMGTINAATARVVEIIGEIDEAEVWAVAGIRSLQHWVTWQCGVSPGRAARWIEVAQRRDQLPACTALFDQGALTEDAMIAIAHRAPSDRDAVVADLAPLLAHAQLRRFLNGLPPLDRDRPEPTRERTVEIQREDEWWSMKARLLQEEGAIVEKALLEARNDVFHDRHPDDVDPDGKEHRGEVSWADGLVRMAESSLLGYDAMRERRPADQRQVILHVDVSDGSARLHLDDAVPDAVRRYFACDADLRLMIEQDGVLCALSRRFHSVDPVLRAFVEDRDGGCRYPGCSQRRWLHIHHIVHWEDGGPTASNNLCALCPAHHRAHHAGEYTIEGDAERLDGLQFRRRSGCLIEPRPPTFEGPAPPLAAQFAHPLGERMDWRMAPFDPPSWN